MWNRFCCAMTLAMFGVSAPVASVNGQSDCPRADLPAYAHNDYENAHPLADALRLGYRGVEADFFLIDDTLRVGHDRAAAMRGRALEELYLGPLSSIVSRCGALTADGSPFLLAFELKEKSSKAYDSLLQLLERYPALFVTGAGSSANVPVQAVLVGWNPSQAKRSARTEPWLRLQLRLSRPEPLRAAALVRVGLISLDYGKTIGRPWITNSRRRHWLAVLSETKRESPAALLRVHNLPVDSAVYSMLLKAGVDLIGTKELDATRRLLKPGGE